ncbi:hypothetical protein C8R43DRAFT_172987 [Mycena crocata]|nr:hypothetical protein C8R43DRAFT_172987 [Mycena crocata]
MHEHLRRCNSWTTLLLTDCSLMRPFQCLRQWECRPGLFKSRGLISFPDDFDPSQPALAPNASIPPSISVSAASDSFPPQPALVSAEDSSVPSSTSNSTSSVETVLSRFEPAESGAPGAPGPTIDPAALEAATSGPVPVPPSSNKRSLSRQTSISFRSAAATANAPAAKNKAPAGSASASTADTSPSLATVATAHNYARFHMAPAPGTTETAPAFRIRCNANDDAIVGNFTRLHDDQLSESRISRERDEQSTLLLHQTRISAEKEAQKLREQIQMLYDVQKGDHKLLSDVVGAVNGLRGSVAGLRRDAPSALAPHPALTQPPPSSSMGPPPSEAGPSRVVNDRPPEDAPTAKRQRTSAPQDGDPYDVWFYDVSTTAEPREIARAAMQAIPHLTGGSFLNAIRAPRNPATISIRFRTRPYALTFIDAIENCPPAGFDGLHACWAPAAANPIAIIRGDGYVGRSG